MDRKHQFEDVTNILECNPKDSNGLKEYCEHLSQEIKELQQHLTTSDRKKVKLNCIDVIEYCSTHKKELDPRIYGELELCASKMLLACFRNLMEPFSSHDYGMLIQMLSKTAISYVVQDVSVSIEYCRKAEEYWKHACEHKGTIFIKEYGNIGFRMYKYFIEIIADHPTDLKPTDVNTLVQCILKLVGNDKIQTQSLSLSLKWYNKGVSLYSSNNYSDAIVWLQYSLDALYIVADTVEVKNEKIARTQRLLSMIYMKMKHYDKALAVLESSLKTFVHIDDLYLKIQILYHLKRPNESKDVTLSLLERNDCTFHKAISCVMYGVDSMPLNELMEIIDKIGHRYSDDTIWIYKLDIFIEKNELTRGIQVLHDVISSHALHDQADISKATLQTLYRITWNQSVKLCSENDMTNAIEWMTNALKLIEATNDVINTPKCLRSLAYMYGGLGMESKLDQAIQFAKRAVDMEKSFESFLHLLIVQIRQKNEQDAYETFKQLEECKEFKASHFALVAHEAMCSNMVEIAARTLEKIISNASNNNNNDDDIKNALVSHEQVVGLWFIVITSVYNNNNNENDDEKQKDDGGEEKKAEDDDDDGNGNDDEMMEKGKNAITHLLHCLRGTLRLLKLNNNGTQVRDDKVGYFAAIARDVGIYCERQDLHTHGSDLFKLSHHFLMLLPLTPQRMLARREVLLMGAISYIERAWIVEPSIATELASKAMECMRDYENLVSSTEKIDATEYQIAHSTVYTAKLFLQDENILLHAQQLSSKALLTTRTLNKMVNLSMMEPFQSKVRVQEACKVLIRMCIERQLSIATINWNEVATLFRQLLMIGTDNDDSLRDAQDVLKFSVAHMDRLHPGFPIEHAKWIVAHCWNIGVRFYRCEQYETAEKFASCSLQLNHTLLPKESQAYANEMRQMCMY